MQRVGGVEFLVHSHLQLLGADATADALAGCIAAGTLTPGFEYCAGGVAALTEVLSALSRGHVRTFSRAGPTGGVVMGWRSGVLEEVDLRSNNFGAEGAGAMVEVLMREVEAAGKLRPLHQRQSGDNPHRCWRR